MHENNSIVCNVQECKYHAGQKDLCTLSKIQIGRSRKQVDSKDCTECDSFEGNR